MAPAGRSGPGDSVARSATAGLAGELMPAALLTGYPRDFRKSRLGFLPNTYVHISSHIETKVAAMTDYRS
jgi:hypothetical protein